MMNINKFRRNFGLVILGCLPTVLFVLGTTIFFDLFYGIFLMMVGILVGSLVAIHFLKHPFHDMVYGKGLGTMVLDSTGLILPLLADVSERPYIRTRIKGVLKESIYNRDIVHYLNPPVKTEIVRINETVLETDPATNETYEVETGKVTSWIRLPDSSEIGFQNNVKYSLGGSIPFLIYNGVIDEFLSKDSLARFEHDSFEKMLALNTQQKLNDILRNIRDFARYSVRSFGEQKGFFANRPWMKWVVIAAVAFIFIMVAVVAFGNLGNLSGVIP